MTPVKEKKYLFCDMPSLQCNNLERNSICQQSEGKMHENKHPCLVQDFLALCVRECRAPSLPFMFFKVFRT